MSVRIPVTLSPHIVNGQSRGFYLLAQKLFPNGAPTLSKQQFIGFNGQLIVTVEHDRTWDTLLKIALHASKLNDESVTWLTPTPIYPMPKGFRAYIPGTIIKPASAGVEKVEGIGVFRRAVFGVSKDVYYLEILKLSAEVLLGRKELI